MQVSVVSNNRKHLFINANDYAIPRMQHIYSIPFVHALYEFAFDVVVIISICVGSAINLYIDLVAKVRSHENILLKLSSNMLPILVKFMHTIQQIKEEFPHLVHGNVAFARKMGFPEVIFPGDVRNDLYLTLISGEFSKGSKSSDKNIEVTAAVCDEKGTVIPGIITLGAGASMMNEYKSVIYYHDDKPKWHETFKVSRINGD